MPSRGDNKREELRCNKILYSYRFPVLMTLCSGVYLSLFIYLFLTDMSNSSLCAAGNYTSLYCLMTDEHIY